MVFSSLTFLQCFLPLCLLAYFFVPQKWRNGVLFLFSLLFYAWGEPVYVVLMLFSTALDYTCGQMVERYRGQHGASWNFVLWGVYFGVLLVLEKLFLLRLLKKLPAILRHIYALVLVTVSWTFFAFTDIARGFAWLKAMFSGTLFDNSSLYLLLTYGLILAVCALAATTLGKHSYEKLNLRLGQRALTVMDCGGLLCVLIASMAYLVSGSYNPFLYFRF